MINFLICLFVHIAEKNNPEWYRFTVLIGTISFVFVFVPFFYIATGRYIERSIYIPFSPFLAYALAVPALLFGGILIVWTLALQYGYGQGSGSHLAPTQKLITFGPYKISRHPMLVGSILFYFGIGTLVSSITVGLYAGIVTAVLAYFFVVYIEEPVLVVRFGDEYKKYQKEVPFIPFLMP